MQNFQYQGFDQSGISQSGTVEADNANEAVKKLAARGLIIQSVVPVNSAIRSPAENRSPPSPPRRPVRRPATQRSPDRRDRTDWAAAPPAVPRIRRSSGHDRRAPP